MIELLTGIVWLLGLSALTAFCVLAEFSLVGSRRTRMKELAEQGNAAARVVHNVMGNTNRYFAAVQLGITATALMTGSIAEPLISDVLTRWLEVSNTAWLRAASTTLGSVAGIGFATYVQLVLAELVPRTVALRYAERIALFFVPPMNLIATVLRPFLILFEQSTVLILRLFGIKHAVGHGEQTYSIAELRILMDESEKGGVIESDQKELLDAVFSFGDTTVREVMVPRTEIVSISAEARLPHVMHVFSTHAAERVPVYENDLDHIVGILHVKDLLRALLPNTRMPTVRQLMREPFFVPDTQRADELLQQFRVKHEHVAVVLDEYSGTAGLVTLNNLIEKIIGEITDSARGESPSIQLTSDGAVINGLTNIGDVNAEFDLNLDDENYDTLGGYVMGRLGRIPKLGDEIVVEEKGASLLLKVEEMDKLRVAKVRLVRKK